MKTTFHGKVQAYASKNNPLQTIVDFVLTDFKANKNNQRIPSSEASNIVASAMNMPIKINFTNNRIKGHAMSVPIGTISEVWQDDDVIRARSILWKAEFPDVDSFLRTATAEGKTVGTSWEILYGRSEQSQNITDLYDCLVQATTIVDDPAYEDRTKILSVAESLAMEDTAPDTTQDPMNQLDSISTALYNLLYVIDELYAEYYQRELEKTALEDATSALDKLKNLVADLRSSMATTVAEKVDLENKLQLVQHTVAEYEKQKAQAEKEQRNAELLEKRFHALTEIGIILSDDQKSQRKERYLSMSETDFQLQLEDLRNFSRSTVIEIPDTLANSRMTPREIAQALKNREKR